MVMGLVSWLSLANHSDSSPSWWCMPCSVKMDAREKDSERWLDMWCLLLTFPELFRLGWLISSVFLTRTSLPKTTHENRYYGAWPGWEVSVRVLPLTRGLWPPRLLCPWDFPGKSTGMSGHFLLQGIFPTQRLNPSLLHVRRILYH